MKIKIIECKGDSVSTYKEMVSCDYFKVEGRHVCIYKDKQQMYHLPARYFGIEVLEL